MGDHETRKLLGALLLVQLEQAALSRTDLAPPDRRPFTLLVDEWPSFAAQERTIGTILSQTRKFNLRLYLAAQSLAQVGSERLTGALENCRLTVVFGLGRNSAEIEAKHIGRVDPFTVKEEGLTETQHALYLSTLDQFEQWAQALQHLPPRTAFVKLHDQPAVKIRTLAVPEGKVSPAEVARVLDRYRQRYQRTQDEAEHAIAHLTVPPAGGSTPPAVPVASPVPAAAGTPAAAPAYTTLFQSPDSDEDHWTN